MDQVVPVTREAALSDQIMAIKPSHTIAIAHLSAGTGGREAARSTFGAGSALVPSTALCGHTFSSGGGGAAYLSLVMT